MIDFRKIHNTQTAFRSSFEHKKQLWYSHNCSLTKTLIFFYHDHSVIEDVSCQQNYL